MKKGTKPIKIVNDSDEDSLDRDDSPSEIGMRASRKSQSQKLSSGNPNFEDSNSIDQFDQDQFDREAQNDYQDSSNQGSNYMKQPKSRGRGKRRGGRIQRGKFDQQFREQSFGLGRKRSRGIGNPRRNTQRIINRMRDQQENQNVKKSSIFMQSQESQDEKKCWEEDNQEENELSSNKDDFDESQNDGEFSDQEEKKRQKMQIMKDFQNKNERMKDRNELFIDSNEQESDVEIQVQKLTQNSDKIRELNNWKLKQYLEPKFQQGKQIPILQPQKLQKEQAQQDLKQDKQTEQEAAYLNQKRRKIRAYAEQFQELKTRRIMKYINGKFDLTVRTLHELVYDCYQQGLISEQLMLSIKHMGIGNYLEFTIKYKEQKLSEFDFQKVKFTLFDHRRLTKLLIDKGKKKQYTIEKPILFSPYQIHVFLEQVYGLPEDVYTAFCQTLGQAYNLTWWKTIGAQKNIQQEQKIQENNNTIKRNSTKRIRYKIKVNQQQQNQQQAKKIVLEERIDINSVKIQHESSRIEKQFVEVKDNQQDSEGKKIKKSDKESAFFSSLLDSQDLIQSFSISSKTNSIQSDLFSDFGEEKQKKPKKKTTKKTKQMMQQKQMEKVKKSSVNLKNVEQEIKNPTLAKAKTKTKRGQIGQKRTSKKTNENKKNNKKENVDKTINKKQRKTNKKADQKNKDGFISDQNEKDLGENKNQQESNYDSDDI